MWVLPLTDGKPAAGATPEAILNSEFDETGPHVSKDGRWLTYGSERSLGKPEIYVGALPRWAPGAGGDPNYWPRHHAAVVSLNGRTLFFVRAPQGMLSAQMMSVAATPDGDTLRFGAAVPLFTARMLPIQTISAGDYDVTPDGNFSLVGTVVGPSKGNLPGTHRRRTGPRLLGK